eukprot:3077228-Amphidinium_carterae.1
MAFAPPFFGTMAGPARLNDLCITQLSRELVLGAYLAESLEDFGHSLTFDSLGRKIIEALALFQSFFERG